MSRTATEGVDDARSGPLQCAVSHDQSMVLGFAEDLNAFPFRSGLGVYPGSGFAGADEAYTDDIGMLNEQAHVIRGAGDHIQDARRQSRFHPQLSEAQGRLRRGTGGLEHESVSGCEAQGDHPAVRNHGRKIPRRKPKKDTYRLKVLDRVVLGRHVHKRFALE